MLADVYDEGQQHDKSLDLCTRVITGRPQGQPRADVLRLLQAGAKPLFERRGGIQSERRPS